MKFLDNLPLGITMMACVLIGLAPFAPMPHVWEKLLMLVAGTLTKPIDIGDLLMHGAPWFLLGAKLIRMATKRPDGDA